MKLVNLSQLINFEEKFNLFDEYVNDIQIWPLIRYQYMQGVLDHYNDFDVPQAKSITNNITKLISYTVQTIKFNPDKLNHPKRIDYLFFAKGTYKQIDGEFYNRITEPYAELFPSRSLLVEESYNFSYCMPRTFENIKFLDLYLIKTRLMVKLLGLEKKYVMVSKEFIDFIKLNSPYELPEDKWNQISKFLCSQLARQKFIVKYITRLIKRIEPKVIFIEEACYGNRAFIVKLAKSMGIKTVELQHGFIGSTHPAYNYGPKLLSNDKSHCPDYILTYGKYWEKSISVPSQVISIGNPSLEKTVRNFNNVSLKVENVFKLLVISSGVDYKQLSDIVIKLIKQNEGKQEIKIIFRAHPLERPVMETRYKELISLGIKMSIVDLYEDIANCTLVFGEFSTALYEAMAFDKKVVMLDNRYSRQYVSTNDVLNVLEYVESAEELSEIILKTQYDNIAHKLNDVWENDWHKNYHKFLGSILN